MIAYAAWLLARSLQALGVRLPDDLALEMIVYEMTRKYPQEPKYKIALRAAHESLLRKGQVSETFEQADERTQREYDQKQAADDAAKKEQAKARQISFHLATKPLRGTIETLESQTEIVKGLGEFQVEPGQLAVEFSFAPGVVPHPRYPESKVLPVAWRFSDATGQRWEIEMKYTENSFPEFIHQDVDGMLPDSIQLKYEWWTSASDEILAAFSDGGLAKEMNISFDYFSLVSGQIQIGEKTVQIKMKYANAMIDLGWLPDVNLIVIRFSKYYAEIEGDFDEIPPFFFTAPLASLFPLTSIFTPLDDALEDGLITYQKLPETGVPQPCIRFVPEANGAG